jgi:CubicO group peptidase (beta-lactamase class C family)
VLNIARLGADRSTQWALFSITKSWLSALTGIALADGAIESIDDPVTRYVRRLRDSAYDGVSIKHVLQMSSGARWGESQVRAPPERSLAWEAAADGTTCSR